MNDTRKENRMKRPKYNSGNAWVILPRWKKRLHGFASYIMLAFLALWQPEIVDWVLYNDLKNEFLEDE